MSNDKILKIAIVGGGASGVFAALHAKQQAADSGVQTRICIYEAADRILKKILVTGNGRCNLSNADVSAARYFGCTDLFVRIYNAYNTEETIAFFQRLGLITVADEAGRYYPSSQKAASVVCVLLRALKSADIETALNTKIETFQKTPKGYLLNGKYYADAVILAAGGMIAAGGKHSDSVYSMLKTNGIHITPLHPALTAFTVRDFTKSLKGIRAVGSLSLSAEGKTLAVFQGEIQYTEYGISGIPAMQLSSYAARTAENARLSLIADSLPFMDDRSFLLHFKLVQISDPDMPLLVFFTGLMPKALAAYLIKESRCTQDVPLKYVSDASVSLLLNNCKRKRYDVKGLRDFENAQITSGGVPSSELTDSLMLKKLPHVYVCGELADINGDCGGYNLQWAWSSGAVAGKNCIMEML